MCVCVCVTLTGPLNVRKRLCDGAHMTQRLRCQERSMRCKNKAKMQRLYPFLLRDLEKVCVVALLCTARLSAVNPSYHRQADTVERRGVNVESY